MGDWFHGLWRWALRKDGSGHLSSNGTDVGSGGKSGTLLEAHVDDPCSWPWIIQLEAEREYVAITLKGMRMFIQNFPSPNELPFLSPLFVSHSLFIHPTII